MSKRAGAGIRPGFEALEERRVLAAPVVTGGHAESGSVNNLVLGRPGVLVAEATDDVGIRAVTFFLDRDGDGAWTKGTDLDLGADVRPSPVPPGAFSIAITPNAGWGLDPFINAYAAALDSEGAWSAPAQLDPFATFTLPTIVAFTTSVRSQQTENGIFYTTTLTASAELPNFGPGPAVAGITFWVDVDANSAWSPGIDIDIGADRQPAADGSFAVAYVTHNVLPTRFGASAFLWRSLGFGPPRVALPYEGAGSVVSGTMINDSGRLGLITDRVGDPMRASLISEAGTSFEPLGATTLFFDANTNGVWDPGTDTDLGGFSFDGPFDVYRARATIAFTLTAEMGSGFRHFVAAVRTDDSVGGTYWGPTRTFFINISAQPTVEDLTPAQASFARNGIVTADFTVRDDFGVRDVLAFLDLDGDQVRDSGEPAAAPGSYVRLTPSLRNGRWRISIDLAGLGLAAGTYSLAVSAVDFNDIPSLAPVTTPIVLT